MLSRTEVERGASHVDDILARFDQIDAKLVAKGFPATSPWWRKTIKRWYRSGKRQLTGRIGRRGGKSSTISRLGVTEALYGWHDVPPGDVGVVAIISTRKDEAAARLNTVTAILDALGIPYKPWGDGVLGVKLVGRRVGFRVFSASIQGVSGFTAIFVFCDEVAKWRDTETGVNPATEVIKSARPTMATMRNARIILSSSPFGMLDAHYDAFEEGETRLGTIAYATTWEANPTLTEEGTHDDEPDLRAWIREYKAIPQAEVEWSLLSEEQLDRATRKKLVVVRRIPNWRYSAAMDPATRTNRWTLVVAGQDPNGKRHVVLAKEWTPAPGNPLQPEVVLREIRTLIAPYGLRRVVTDQLGVDFMRAILRLLPKEERIVLTEEPWTPQTKRAAYEHLLKLAQANRLGLPPDKMVRVDLLGIMKRITRSGNVTYELATRGTRHSDYAPSIAFAVADARYAGKRPEAEKDVDEQAKKAKAAFFEERRKQRERERRYGRLPVTHSTKRIVPQLPA